MKGITVTILCMLLFFSNNKSQTDRESVIIDASGCFSGNSTSGFKFDAKKIKLSLPNRKVMGVEVTPQMMSAFTAVGIAYQAYSSMQEAQYKQEVLGNLEKILTFVQEIKEDIFQMDLKLSSIIERLDRIEYKIETTPIENELRQMSQATVKLQENRFPSSGSIFNNVYESFTDAFRTFRQLRSNKNFIYYTPDFIKNISLYITYTNQMDSGKVYKERYNALMQDIIYTQNDLKKRINELKRFSGILTQANKIKCGEGKYSVIKNSSENGLIYYAKGLIHENKDFTWFEGKYAAGLSTDFQVYYLYKLEDGFFKRIDDGRGILFLPISNKKPFIRPGFNSSSNIQSAKIPVGIKANKSFDINEWTKAINIKSALRWNQGMQDNYSKALKDGKKYRFTSEFIGKEIYTSEAEHVRMETEVNTYLEELYILSATSELLEKSKKQIMLLIKEGKELPLNPETKKD